MNQRYVILFICISVFLCVLYFNSQTPCTVLERIPYVDGTTIDVVGDSCSEGLPHTIDRNTIIMPLSSWTSSHRESTLRHELVHIRQRRDASIWYTFYRDEWGYESVALPPELDSRSIRPNPDTADSPFMLWRGKWLFLPIYNADHTLRNADVRVYDIQNKSFTSIPPEWTAFFSASKLGGGHGTADLHQYEHPHEISAEFLTSRRECSASLKLYSFFQKNYS